MFHDQVHRLDEVRGEKKDLKILLGAAGVVAVGQRAAAVEAREVAVMTRRTAHSLQDFVAMEATITSGLSQQHGRWQESPRLKRGPEVSIL